MHMNDMRIIKKISCAAVTLFISANVWANSFSQAIPSLYYQPKEIGSLAETTEFKSVSSNFATKRQIPAYKPHIEAPSHGPQKTGIVHALSEPIHFDKLTWETLADGGYSVKAHIQAKLAKHLRLHLQIRGNHSVLEVRIKGNAASSQTEYVAPHIFQSDNIWLPITEGDEAIIELYVRTREARESISVILDQVNYLFAYEENGQFSSLGKTQYPEYDVTCWSSDPAYNMLINSAASIANIHFINNNSSYLCTGTLLADMGGTFTPWFVTANHCISTQIEADSMSLDWFYQAHSCGSNNTDSRYKRQYGGAELLWTSPTHDASFLQLNSTPPSGVVYSGWDARPLNVGQKVWGIHHPKGDHTMVSMGEVAALNVPATVDGHLYILNEAHYSQGGTEQGSSGSGLFSSDGTILQWRGTLTGGPAGDYQRSLYSPFSSYYVHIKPYLSSTSPYTPRTESLSPSWRAFFTVSGTLPGDIIDTSDLRLLMDGTNCTRVDANGYTCTIPTSMPFSLPSTEQDCGQLTPNVARVRKSKSYFAAPWIADSFTVTPSSINLGKSSLCAYSTFNGKNLTIVKNGLTFDQKVARILDCAEKVAGEAFPLGGGTTQYDSMLDTTQGAASVERTYSATGWGSAVLRQSATDVASNFYYYRVPGGNWAKLGNIETVNSQYCHAW